MSTDTATETRTFTVGQRVTARNPADHTSPYKLNVVKRTKCFVTFYDATMDRDYRVGIKTDDDGNEWALPFGSYSMAPVAFA